MSEHTPGPWKWWTSNSWRRLKRDDRGITQNVLEPYVCRDGHPDLSISDADMRLIAAAPELFAALQQVAILGHGKCTIGKPLAEMVLAALAHATGAGGDDE